MGGTVVVNQPGVHLLGAVSAVNSTTALLAGAAVFTGTSEDVINYASITIAALTSHDSATNGLSVEWSINGTDWDHVETYSVLANIAFFANLTVRARYFRLVYTNGATLQTTFRLQTLYAEVAPTARKRPIQDVPVDNDPAALIKAVIAGKTTAGGGAYVDVKVTPSGAVLTDGDVAITDWIGSTAPTVGQKTMAASLPVTIASDQTAVPISASALPLPALAATSTIQTDRSQKTQITNGTIDVAVKAASTAAVAGDTAIVVAVSPNNTIPVSISSQPLPSGAATEATLALIKAKTDNLDVALSTRAVTGLTDAQLRATAVPVSAASLPLPSGAATNAVLTDRTQKTQITNGTIDAAVKAASTAAIATDTALVVAISPNNTIPVSAASLPLPSGAATSALQTTGNTSVGNIDTKTPSLGQGTMAASSPVVIASNQTAVPISAASLPLPSGAATNTVLTNRTQKTQITNGTVDAAVKAASTAAVATDVALVVAISPNNTIPVSADSLPLPAGAATNAVLTDRTQKSQLTNGTLDVAVKAASTAAVAADIALVVAVSPNNTVPVSLASQPLPTGAATETTLASRLAESTFTGRTPSALVSGRFDVNNGAWLGSTAPTVGQKAMSSSIPVALASDQSALSVNLSGNTAGTYANGAQTAVAGTAVQVLASNGSRKSALIQNVGTENVRVGITGVTATTGVQLTPGSSMVFDSPFCPTGAVFAIREGASSSTVFAQEIT